MKIIDLSGKIAVVTGGAGQVGRGIVKRLAECGADVAICYNKSGEYAEELKSEIVSKYNVRAMAIQADVTDADSVTAMKKAVCEKLGTVGIIVINAMVRHEWKKVLEQPPAIYESQFKGFMLHTVNMAQAFAPDMIANRWGRIIGINSECAMQMFPYQSAYASAKRGMDGILRVLAKEIGEYNVTVNEIAPGWVVTDNCRETDENEPNYMQDFPYIPNVPLRRRCTDYDIGDAVCFLASNMADCISGVYLPVDGGNVMPCI